MHEAEAAILSASRRRNRPRPPAPEPLEKTPGPLKFFHLVRANPIAGLTRSHFELPIVIRKTVFGTIAFVSDPAAVRNVLVDNAQSYGKARLQQRVLMPILGDGLLTAGSDRWRTQRRIIGPLFTPKFVACFAPAMAESAHAAVGKWKNCRDKPRLDIAAEMARITIDVLERTVLLDGIRGNHDEVVQAVTHYFNTAGRPGPLDAFNVPDWVPLLGRLRVRRSLALAARTVDMIIATRRARIAADPLSAPTDLVTILLRAGDPKNGGELSAAEIKSNIVTFIAAGHETTANALTWALYLLSVDPEWRERIETEVDLELPDGKYLEGSLERLVATRAVIEEAMRLYPSIPMISRQAVVADQLAGRSIAPGTTVIISPWVIHRHRLLWEAPDVFDPSRFLPGAREVIDRFAYLPFSVGPRACIAASFALQEMIIILAVIVRSFRLELVPGHEVWPVHRISLRPDGGLPMVLHRREQPA
jgi:cytochrome P450